MCHENILQLYIFPFKGKILFCGTCTAHFPRELHKKAKCYLLILEINKKGIKFLLNHDTWKFSTSIQNEQKGKKKAFTIYFQISLVGRSPHAVLIILLSIRITKTVKTREKNINLVAAETGEVTCNMQAFPGSQLLEKMADVFLV